MDNIQRLPDYLKTKIASIDNKEYKKVNCCWWVYTMLGFVLGFTILSTTTDWL